MLHEHPRVLREPEPVSLPSSDHRRHHPVSQLVGHRGLRRRHLRRHLRLEAVEAMADRLAAAGVERVVVVVGLPSAEGQPEQQPLLLPPDVSVAAPSADCSPL